MNVVLSPSPTVSKRPADARRVFASRGARLVVLALFAALAALRILFVLHYRIDSDEPQHLHVVWGWTHGLMQYRDVFDNHTPLFHLLCIPLLKLVGERADALIFMRFAMIPFFVCSLWCVYRLGVLLKSAEVGIWAAVFAALSPAFCYTSTEYRPDDMWTTLWLVSLVVLLGGELNVKRGLAAGLLFGATIATSMKTLALLGCLGAAAVTGLLLDGGMRRLLKDRRTYIFLGTLLAGSIVVPGLLALWFAKQHALHDALYGIFTYNSVPGLGRLRSRWVVKVGVLEMIGAVALLIPLSGWLARRVIAPERRLSFHLIFLSSGLYGTLIYSLWPLLDAEHLIPFYPLIVTGLMPLVVDTLTRVTPRRTIWQLAAPAIAAFAIMAAEAWTVRINAAAGFTKYLADLLRLSNPTDYVMDVKGETIFRPRPCPYLFEGVGIARAQRGLMPDDVPEQMIAKQTCITTRPNYRFISQHTLGFMRDNYITIGSYHVLGHAMTPVTEPQTYTFDVAIPETFAFIAAGKTVSGSIDAQPCKGFATLSSGTHVFVSNRPLSEVDFVWKQAIDRGFFP
jgi:hypothetical protein